MLGGNDQYKGATLCLEEKILEKEMVISYNETKGAFLFTKCILIFSTSDTECG
jgi:hypothetical protein